MRKHAAEQIETKIRAACELGRHDDAAERGRWITLGTRTASELTAQVASRTDAYLKSEFKDRFRQLRERLPKEDNLLLILRTGRDLPWRDIALVFAGEGVEPSDEELTREAARLRKRFQLVKQQLRALARSEGLID